MKIVITRAADEKSTLIPIAIGDVNIAEVLGEIKNFEVFKLKSNFGHMDILSLYEILNGLK